MAVALRLGAYCPWYAVDALSAAALFALIDRRDEYQLASFAFRTKQRQLGWWEN